MDKTAILINSMAGGGAERVVSILLKEFSKKERPVFLITLESKFYYDIPSNVKDIKIFSSASKSTRPGLVGKSTRPGLVGKFFGIFWASWKLKKIIKENKIDGVISFLGRSNYVNVLVKMFGSKHRVLISERINPSKMHSGFAVVAVFNKLFTKILYKKADLIVANSQGIKESLVKDFAVDQEKIKVIYNPVDIENIKTLSSEPLEEKYREIFKNFVIINVARLEKQKGQDSLIKAFFMVKKEIPLAKLIVLGEGYLERELKNLAKELSLQDNVYFLGWQKNPFKFMARSKLFVLSSLWEGFPNTLLEAMAVGLPVISTDCQSGPNEIISNRENGILVELGDEKIMAEAIVKLLTNESLAIKLSQKAAEKVKEFSKENIINQYTDVFN